MELFPHRRQHLLACHVPQSNQHSVEPLARGTLLGHRRVELRAVDQSVLEQKRAESHSTL